MSTAPDLPTRRLTGLIPWPFTLLAGCPDGGKSYAAYEASNSPLVNRSFLLPYGEQVHEDYLPIAPNLEVIDNNGTVQHFTELLAAASAQPPGEDGRPNLLIVDGLQRVWETLSSQVYFAARVRQYRKQNNIRGRGTVTLPYRSDVGLDDPKAAQDLWNSATERWNEIIRILKNHPGPAIATTMLKEVTIIEGNSAANEWKIEGKHTLRSECGAMVCIPYHREFYVVRVKSLKMAPLDGDLEDAFTRDNRWDGDFTFDAFWRALGVTAESQGSTQAQVERQSNTVVPIFSGEELKAHVKELILDDQRQNGPNQDPIRVLGALLDEAGADALRALTVETSEGAMDGAAYVQNLRGFYVERAQRTQQQQQAPARTQQQAPAPAQEQRAQQQRQQGPAPTRQAAPQQAPPPTQQQEHPAARAAREQTRTDAASSNVQHEQVARGLAEEAAGHAEVLGRDLAAYVAPLLRVNIKAKRVEDIHPGIVLAWIVEQRPAVITELRKQGRATAAERLTKASDKPITWASIVEATQWDDASAQEDQRQESAATA